MTRTLTTEPTVAARMTRCPISVPIGATFYDIAAILVANRIGAVPVLDGRGRLAGVVSESDLMRAILRARRKPRELTARELMAGSPVTVSPDVPISTAARLLGEAGRRRAFVVEDGRVVGVLCRRDLLRGYVRGDEDVRAQVEATLRDALADGAVIRVRVEGGVVFLLGRVEWRSELSAIVPFVRDLPGVVEVRNRVRYVWDDVARRSWR
jgi:CBS domain-containing protein